MFVFESLFGLCQTLMKKKLTRPKTSTQSKGPVKPAQPAASAGKPVQKPVQPAPAEVKPAPVAPVEPAAPEPVVTVEKPVIVLPKIGEGKYDTAAIASFYDVEDVSRESYEFNCPFVCFDGIGELKNATSIKAINGLFTSFRGAVEMPKLKSVSLAGSPVSLKSRYRTMVLCAFGESVCEIDGTAVTDGERQEIASVRECWEMITEFVRAGNILHSRLDAEYVEVIRKKCVAVPSAPAEGQVMGEREAFARFMDKAEVTGFLEREMRSMSTNDETMNKWRQKFAELETVMSLDSGDIQKQLNALSSVCDVSDLRKEVADITERGISDLKNEINSVVAQVPGGNFAELAYSPLKQYANRLLQMLKEMEGKMLMESKDMGSKIVPMRSMPREVVGELENLWTRVQQCGPLAEYHGAIDAVFEQFREREEFARLRSQRLPVACVVEQLTSLVADEVLRNRLRSCCDKISAFQTLMTSMREVPVYLRLLRKCFREDYFVAIRNICSNALNEAPESDSRVKADVSRMMELCAYVSEHVAELIRIYGLLPTVETVRAQVGQMFLQCQQRVLNFYHTTVLTKLREEIQKSTSSSNDPPARKATLDKATEIGRFLADVKEWNEQTQAIPTIFRDICLDGEESVAMDIVVGMNTSHNHLIKLQQQVKDKDEEITRLRAELQAK